MPLKFAAGGVNTLKTKTKAKKERQKDKKTRSRRGGEAKQV
jgi:hypothetical protein